MAEEENERIARTVYEAFNDRDFDRGVALIAENGEWVNLPTGDRFHGPDGFRRNYDQWASAFPDGKCEDIHVIAGGGFVAVEFVGRGTNTGPLITPAGEIPATGRAVEVPFCDVHEIRNGKIVAGRSYFDLATMLRQLGLLPEAPVGATA